MKEEKPSFIIPIAFVIILSILLLLVSSFVVDSISKEIEKEELEEQTREAMEEIKKDFNSTFLFILIITLLGIITIPIFIVGRKQDDMELDSNIDTAKISIEPGKYKEIDVAAILKKRYVRGEISSEEYTEKMSRLWLSDLKWTKKK